MKTLYLHAGMHKTGSKSIQAYLGANADYFRENDILVVNNADPWPLSSERISRSYNCFSIANVLIRNSLQTYARLSGLCQYLSEVEKRIKASEVNDFLHRSENEKLVVSAEAFSFLRTSQEKQLYELMCAGIAVKPIVFFRNKKHWLESWEKQLARKGALHPRKARAGEGIYDLSNKSWLLDYERIVEFFEPHGISMDYDDVFDRDGSVIPSFIRVLGLDDAACPPSGDIFENRSS